MNPSSHAAKASRLPSLDVLRFVAASAVMLYHFTYIKSTDPSLPLLQLITRHGYLGVELFFLISGFVILWSARDRSARQFVRARSLRLFPEFWIAVPLSAFVFCVVPGGAGDSLTLSTVAANLTMVPQLLGFPYVDGVYWTLFVELKFYFLVWLVVAFGQLSRLEVLLGLWTASLVALEAGVRVPGLSSLALYPYGAYFAAGGVFFLVYDQGWSKPRAALIVSCLVLACRHAARGIDDFVAPSHITDGARLVNVIVVVGLFSIFSMIARSTRTLPESTTVSLMGRLTYPLYLVHNSAKELLLAGGTVLPRVVAVPAAIALALFTAIAVNHIGVRHLQPVLRRALDRLRLA